MTDTKARELETKKEINKRLVYKHTETNNVTNKHKANTSSLTNKQAKNTQTRNKQNTETNKQNTRRQTNKCKQTIHTTKKVFSYTNKGQTNRDQIPRREGKKDGATHKKTKKKQDQTNYDDTKSKVKTRPTCCRF